MAQTVMAQLIEFGEVQRGRLGVMIQDLTPDLAAALGVAAETGAIVSSVEPGTPADRAGLAAGAVIVAVDGQTVAGSADLRQKIWPATPRRQGRDRLSARWRASDDRGRAGRIRRAAAPSATAPGADALSGVRLVPLDRTHPAWGEVEGVVVADVAPGSRAARSGLQAGDVITAVNRQPVATIRDIDRALEQAPGAVALSVWREGQRFLVILRS